MSENEDRGRLLADFFKSLGEVDEQVQGRNKAFDKAVTYIQLLFGQIIGCITSNYEPDIVKTRIYGSTAENLKNYSFVDGGDVDMLLFPGDKVVVDERMLEYLPSDPAFVKIRGDGHPLF